MSCYKLSYLSFGDGNFNFEESKGHLEGVPQHYLGDLRSLWLLTSK